MANELLNLSTTEHTLRVIIDITACSLGCPRYVEGRPVWCCPFLRELCYRTQRSRYPGARL